MVEGDISDLAAGMAAEHLVCADLILKGYKAFLTDQFCHYDVVAEVDKNLIRIQVKTTRMPKPVPQRKSHIPAYLFHVRRFGKGGRHSYKDDDFDMLALVALDIKKIAYVPLVEVKQTIHIYGDNHDKGKKFEDFPFDKALEVVMNGEK